MKEWSSSHERMAPMAPDRENEHQRKPSRRFIFLHKTADSKVAAISQQGKTSMVTMEMKRYISLLGVEVIKEEEPDQQSTHKMTKRENPCRVHRSRDAKRRLRKNWRKYIDCLAIHTRRLPLVNTIRRKSIKQQGKCQEGLRQQTNKYEI